MLVCQCTFVLKANLRTLSLLMLLLLLFPPLSLTLIIFFVVKLRNWLEVYMVFPLQVNNCFHECLCCKFFNSLIGKRYIDFMAVCCLSFCLFVRFIVEILLLGTSGKKLYHGL